MAREATSHEKQVFGHNVQIGEDDKPIEQGFGALKRKSPNLVKLEAPAEAEAKVALGKLEERAAQEKRDREAKEDF